ncbi:porin family protein [Psychrobacter aestuarii]|uniref:Outer membrane protein beta-barrel domain-containing protein n=1 Tax=Psychrobacter aestuarii TaxID=556327 RepID=A0ABN0W405_9GAMM|nr:porin family protein [Psychrobacter aestuarii]
MKLLNKALVSLLLGSVMTMSAQAAVSYTNGQAYVGAKVGQYMPDGDVSDDIEDATSYGFYTGYQFTPTLGVEAEYLTTTTEEVFNDTFEKSEYSADVYGLYGTLNYVFPNTGLYAKGRLGIAKNEAEAEYTDKIVGISDKQTYSDSGIAGGLGLGYSVTPMASVEAMYNIYPSIDIGDGDELDATGITLGAHVKF